MKTKFVPLCLALVLILTAFTSEAQVNLGIGAGYSSKSAGVAQLSLGYQAKFITTEAGYIAHLSNKVGKGAIFFSRAGLNLEFNDTWKLNPTFGYAYLLNSNDRKYLNTDGLIYGLGVEKEIPMNGSLYLQVNYFKPITIATFGVKFYFGRDNKK
jgi:hypothetical protein